jgi:hypothetical protein
MYKHNSKKAVTEESKNKGPDRDYPSSDWKWISAKLVSKFPLELRAEPFKSSRNLQIGDL